MIDFHSHILPRVDDGSTSLEMSLAMLEAERDHGVKAVVATPHFYAREDTPERFLTRRQQAVEALRQAIKGREDLPKLLTGAEVAYYRGMSDSEALWELRIADTNYILVEPPPAPWDSQVFRELRELPSKQNLYPIVAHVDRYLLPFWSKKMLNRLGDLPVLLQANAGSFLRGGKDKTLFRLLKEERIHLLGSDCHDLDSRAPNLGQLLPRLTGEMLAHIRFHQETVLGEG